MQNAGGDNSEHTNTIFYFDVGDDLYIIHTGASTGSSGKDGSAGTDCTINDMASGGQSSTALVADVKDKQPLSSDTTANSKVIANINMHKFDTSHPNKTS